MKFRATESIKYTAYYKATSQRNFPNCQKRWYSQWMGTINFQVTIAQTLKK